MPVESEKQKVFDQRITKVTSNKSNPDYYELEAASKRNMKV
jgi:hypothetical protein